MKRGYSQMETAFRARDATGSDRLLSPQYVSNYERGVAVPGANVLGAICLALDCSADYLLNLTDKEKS